MGKFSTPILAAIVAVSATAALAAPSVDSGITGGNQGTDNVLANACDGSPTQSGSTTVQGCLNTDQDRFVNFTSDENLTYSGGQATIDSADDSFDDLRIEFDDGGGFTKLILNIDAYTNGFVSFFGSFIGDDSEFAIEGPQALDNSGQNFFTLFAGDDDAFDYVRFTTSPVNFDPPGPRPAVTQNVADVNQVRLGGGIPGGGTGGEVPEPATMGLFGLGLLGLGALRRRKI